MKEPKNNVAKKISSKKIRGPNKLAPLNLNGGAIKKVKERSVTDSYQAQKKNSIQIIKEKLASN